VVGKHCSARVQCEIPKRFPSEPSKDYRAKVGRRAEVTNDLLEVCGAKSKAQVICPQLLLYQSPRDSLEQK
jgi:hypothetical protein